MKGLLSAALHAPGHESGSSSSCSAAHSSPSLSDLRTDLNGSQSSLESCGERVGEGGAFDLVAAREAAQRLASSTAARPVPCGNKHVGVRDPNQLGFGEDAHCTCTGPTSAGPARLAGRLLAACWRPCLPSVEVQRSLDWEWVPNIH